MILGLGTLRRPLCFAVYFGQKQANKKLTAVITTYRNTFLQLRHLIAIALTLLMQTGH